MLEVIFVFLGLLLLFVFCGAFAIVIAHHVPAFSQLRTADLVNQPRVILSAQLAAYLIVFGVLWRYFAHHFGIGFLRALSWQWPLRWPGFLGKGVLLALAVQICAHFLPSPPELPVDKMLRTASDAWLLSVFGVLIAPFVEEVLFRGLLFPALTRRAGPLFSLVMTSLLFGAVHSQQLAGARTQVAVIVIVGGMLTMIRWRYHSLACSTLVHAGYNATLFLGLYIHTRGFTHFH